MIIKIIHSSLPEKRSTSFKNILGAKYGNWTVTEYAGKTKNGTTKWLCYCGLCGEFGIVNASSLNRGRSSSCGCERTKDFVKRSTKHGMFGSSEYSIWNGMIGRCYRKSTSSYPRYGGRGITVCDRWLESFENFYSDMGPRPSKDHSIERTDNDGNYDPSNCVWATQKQQVSTKSTTRKFDIDGDFLTIKEIAEKTGIEYKTLRSRINNGMTIDKAISIPKRKALDMSGMNRNEFMKKYQRERYLKNKANKSS